MAKAEGDFLKSLENAADKETCARSCFDALDKPKLRAVLYREQHHLCAYCERRIGEVGETPRIDHWRPLNREPQEALNWKNLYLSCSVKGTCDDAKGGKALAWRAADPSLPWPTVQHYEDWVGFTSGGEMYARTSVPATQRQALENAIREAPTPGLDGPAALNLNDRVLVEARKAAIDSERTSLRKAVGDRYATREEREARASAHLGQSPYPEYVSVRVAWLRRTLGDGRP